MLDPGLDTSNRSRCNQSVTAHTELPVSEKNKQMRNYARLGKVCGLCKHERKDGQLSLEEDRNGRQDLRVEREMACKLRMNS